jgi:hypothetical protein
MTTALETEVRARLELRKRQRERGLSYLTNPVAFASDRLGAHLWSKQRNVAESVRDHRHTAVHSCHASGKSFLAARIVAWWLTCHAPGEAFAVTTAPTFAQVRAILWREIRRAHTAGKLPGRVNQTEWHMPIGDNDELVAFGRKPSDYDTAAFQGIHARAVLVIIDEAAGVPNAIWEAVETITTSDDSRILAIGNPDDVSSRFAQVCTPGNGWNVIGISAFDTPNFTGEAIPDDLRHLLISQTWVDERSADWGEGSPMYISRVLGEFPENAEDSLIRLSQLRACQFNECADTCPEDCDRQEHRPRVSEREPVELGVDVGAGGDMTVVWARQGQRALRKWSLRTPDSEQAAALVMTAIRETGASRVKVDSIGVGWGIVGRLRGIASRQNGKGATIIPVNVGSAARQRSRFPKLRDEIWWTAREMTAAQAWDLQDVDETTIGQLLAPKYSEDPMGRIKVEPKDDTRARIGRSPDDADALLLAYYAPSIDVEGERRESVWGKAERPTSPARGKSAWT